MKTYNRIKTTSQQPTKSMTETKLCKTCGVHHPLDAFDKYKSSKGDIRYRQECRKARLDKRKLAVKEAPKIDPNNVPLPEKCIKCGRKPPECKFQWRTGLKKPAWRNVCNQCRTDGPPGHQSDHIETPSEVFCKSCKVNHPCGAFETYKVNGNTTYRLECKRARANKRKKVVEEANKVDPSTVPLPDECIKCTKKPPECEFKWRFDLVKGGWRNVCNRCSDVNSDGITHSQAYRKREITKNPQAYRERNAKTHQEWAHKNPEKVKKQQRLMVVVPERRFKALITYVRAKHGKSAEADHIVMNDAEKMQAKMSDPCEYCGHAPALGDKLNGLDRVDSNGNYSDINTVACCGVCNAMKNAFNVNEFLEKIREIVRHQRPGAVTYNVPRPPAFGGTTERRNIIKNKENNLSIDIKMSLWAGECYLCGSGPALGIDRVDSTGEYTINNCKSCCMLCNFMKKDWTLDEFLGHASRVYNHTSMWMLGDTSNTLNFVTGPRQPIAAFDQDGKMLIVFPSQATADRVCGTGAKCGISWSNVDISVYKTQYIDSENALILLKKLRN
jgi:hypothetical protein